MKKRHITLIEIMIVILLIGIITSVVGYNVKGSLEKGKIFKTEHAQSQIRDLLLLEVARGTNIEEVVKNYRRYLKESGMTKDLKAILKDGWGDYFEIKLVDNKTDIKVISKNLDKYNKNKEHNKIDEKDY